MAGVCQPFFVYPSICLFDHEPELKLELVPVRKNSGKLSSSLT